MNKNNLYLLLLQIFLVSCESLSNSENSLNFDLEYISIPITSDYLNTYQGIHSYNYKDQNYLLAYNNTRHSLNYFDLDKNEVIKSVQLDHDGPNAIGDINSLFFHNQDSIFLFERGILHLANSEGQVVDSYNLYELFNTQQDGEPSINFYFKLNYNPVTKNILFYLNSPYNSVKEKSKLSKVGTLNVQSRSVDILPIYHTDNYKNVNGRVGYITYLGFYDYHKGDLLYNFQYESSLFVYNMQLGSQISKSGNSVKKPSFINEVPTSTESESFENHALNNTLYLTVIPDKWRGLVYRINWEKPKKDYTNADFTEKGQTLSVFDDDLNFIQEFSLPDHTYQINNWFVNENGLYLNYAHPKNENQKEDFLIFHVIKFNKIN